LRLKGFPGVIVAYEVRGLRPLDAGGRGIAGLSSPVVGRDAEVEQLRRCVENLDRGRGQVVSIVGEAGLGKSRLKIERRENLPEGIRWLEGRCHAYTESTSYAPLIEVLRTALRLTGAETTAMARTKVRAAIRSLAPDRYDHVRAAVTHLLGTELEPGQRGNTSLDPRQLQAQIVVGLRALLEGMLARGPIVLAVEDIHWADTASIDTLTVLTELTDFLPLMILVTSRPDVDGGSWSFRFHVQRNFPHRLTELPLRPLAPEASATLAENLLHVSDLSEPLRQRMLERSEGNPFFLEEIIRTMIERQALRRDGDRWVAAVGAEEISLPATLRGVIAARIDRLPEAAKAALQRASVIGRSFTQGALRALADTDVDLDRALAELMRAELVREQRRLPEPEYLFKHALTQEAAYAGILLEQRRGLHRRLAEHLEHDRAAGDEQSAVLAHHWLVAEDWEKALAHTVLAADRARRLYARPEAIKLFWQAVELFERLPRTPERSRVHIDVILGLVSLPGWMLDEARRKEGLRQIDVAIETATESGEEALGLLLDANKGFILTDVSLLKQTISRAEALADAPALAFAHSRYGAHLGNVGRFEDALDHTRRAIDIYGIAGARYDQAFNSVVGARCYSARAGRFDDALQYAAHAREIGEALDDARLRAWRAMEAEPYFYKGLWTEVARAAEENLPVAFEIGEWTAALFGSAWLGIAHLELGRLAEAERVLERAAREGQARLGTAYPMSFVLIALAQLRNAQGEPARAVEAARESLALSERGSFRLEQGAAHRVLGKALAALGRRAEADAAFRTSLEILEAIQSRPEVAMTLLAHGRFLLGEDAGAGRAKIEQALALFEHMGATGWIEEARKAL
ncbi:MAG TPA: AAA family ATPase, partial [Candidatus Acidoferrum sp.]|nr:AAA family ATPase [Candidatus Acidoferrum sp.]